MTDKIYGAESLEEVNEQLNLRDEQDRRIDAVNRQKLEALGLKLYVPKRFVEIDTGEIVGINNVVEHITQLIAPTDQTIAIQGFAGVGKSSTTKALKDVIDAISVSFGEIFRYLTFMHYVHGQTDHLKNISQLSYQIEGNNLYLCRGDENLSHKLARHLSDPKLSVMVPSISAQTQDIVIKFVEREVRAICQQSESKILLEGRSFTLDFLPCDLRIELCAEPIIRAKRRLNQEIDS